MITMISDNESNESFMPATIQPPTKLTLCHILFIQNKPRRHNVKHGNRITHFIKLQHNATNHVSTNNPASAGRSEGCHYVNIL